MPCRRLVLLVLAATVPALATAAPGGAKGVAELKACGSDGCHAAQDRGLRRSPPRVHPYPAARLPLDRPAVTSSPPARAAAPAGDAAGGGGGPSVWWIALLGAAALGTLAAILAHCRHGPAA